jgi:hypothetical protein
VLDCRHIPPCSAVPLLLQGNLGWHLGPTCVIQINLPISRSLIISPKTLYPNKVLLKVWGTRTWYFGSHFFILLILFSQHKVTVGLCLSMNLPILNIFI